MIPKKRHIILIIIILSGMTSNLFSQELKFKSLTVENGLSNNEVFAVIQDRNGFMWFGTNDGLNRFDGYNFKIFRNNPNDSNSISDNTIKCLFEDKKGNLWIGTKSGVLNKYDPISEKFTKWKLNSNSATYRSIKSIYEDSKGNFWIGTHLDGLFELNIKNGAIKQWKADTTKANSLSHNYVTSTIEDNSGNILIGTYNGLNIFHPDKPENGFKTFYHDSDNTNSLSSNIIWRFSKSRIDSNIIWIGSFNNITRYDTKNSTFKRIEIDNSDKVLYGRSCEYVFDDIVYGEKILWVDSYGGLLRINLTSGKSKRFIHTENNSQSLIDNEINQTLIDNNGIIWCGTENGISYSTPKSSRFNSTIYNSNIFLLKDKEITVISKFDSNRVWIGTKEGLYLFDSKNNIPKLERINKLDGYSIYSLEPINNNEIWIGTFGQGLKHFNYAENKITNWDLDKTKFPGQSINFNQAVFQDSKKNIWIGYSDAGIVRLNPKTGKYKLWSNEPDNKESLSDNSAWVIKEDRLGRIWIGTLGGGLNLFVDKGNGKFRQWLKTENNNKISSNRIYSICEAKKNKNEDNSRTILWLATSNGLNRLTIINNKPNSNIYDIEVANDFYTIKDGLSSNVIKSIVEDDDGNLWLGTNSGISFFDVKTKVFSNYSKEDGLNGTEMNSKSALKLNKQFLLFGGTKGLNVFNPKSITNSNYKPNLIITDFEIFNKSPKIGENSPLKKSLLATQELNLLYNQNVFSFEFAALDYNSPKSIKYAYMMEGFEKDWTITKRRFVTYTNLDPGDYIFKVKSTNADGLWNDNTASMKVVITPPWWQSLWAYGIYFALIVIGLYAIRRFELNRTKLRNELKLKEIEVKQKSELEEIKSRFFANLSHEFRTPLLLIKGPLENLKNNFGLSNNENIDIIERNSKRLQNLIDQLLELSQLEKASVPLKASKENIVIILKGLISSFESLAKQKNIQLTFRKNINDEIFWIDKEKFEKIINNLLSNAIKFTPDFGKVEVSINKKSENGKSFAELVISDSGISIPQDKIDKIFDRFYQVDDTSKRTYGGSGIGLALVKEFIKLHKWNISVKSDTGKGTEFKIEIPYGDEHLSNDEKIKTELQDYKSSELPPKENFSINQSPIYKQDIKDEKNKNSILIVEDSKDVRKYLSGLLKEKYQVFEAENGNEGLKMTAETIPDLIISDVMMPSMDGIEFCRKIKDEWQTSDIPIILLTAKASFENKMEGLEIGADDYITKPFESEELFIRIKNLLDQRKRIKQKLINNIDVSYDSTNIESADDDFIKKVLDVIDKNMEKDSFSTDQLAKELFMSRSKLYRKVHKITGQAPGEFIRTIKLKKAAKLLLENKLSVTQIAYEIGFSSPAHFSKVFSKQFNCNPSEFLSKQKPS